MDRVTSLLTALESKDLQEFLGLFLPEDLAWEGYFGGFLHEAAQCGSLSIVKFLVEQGADINLRSGATPLTPLGYAARRGHLNVVRCLVEAGAKIDDEHPMLNALMRAAGDGHTDVVRYLVSIGADPHAAYRIPLGNLINALTQAETSGHGEVVAYLKSLGCRKPIEGVDKPVWEPKPENRVDQTPEFRRYRAIIEYMEERFGPADPNGQQEIVPKIEGMSVAINSIAPSEDHPFRIFFTNGMSDLPMKTPKGQMKWQYAELVIHLPPDWPSTQQAGGDPQWMWPVNWLRHLAYQPHENKSWLGQPAAIVSSGDPPEPLGPNTRQSCFLLLPDYGLLEDPLTCEDGREIHYYTVVPLYREERDYGLKHGIKAFFQKFAEAEVPVTVDLSRPSFVK